MVLGDRLLSSASSTSVWGRRAYEQNGPPVFFLCGVKAGMYLLGSQQTMNEVLKFLSFMWPQV